MTTPTPVQPDNAPQATKGSPFNAEKSSDDVYMQGVSVGLFDIPKETANAICASISTATGARIDWHYIAGRVHIKALPPLQKPSFQGRVQPWMMECFGPEISNDRIERNHRFFEEAAELVQALGMTASEAHQLVEYTFNRPAGEPLQEAGGVMVTLAALCLAADLDMHVAGETELSRINVPGTIAKIRAKQAAKPKHSPLPEVSTPMEGDALDPKRLDFLIENQAWVQWVVRDGSITQCQVWNQNEDEIYPILSGDDRYFNTSREAIDAAVAAMGGTKE